MFWLWPLVLTHKRSTTRPLQVKERLEMMESVESSTPRRPTEGDAMQNYCHHYVHGVAAEEGDRQVGARVIEPDATGGLEGDGLRRHAGGDVTRQAVALVGLGGGGLAR